MMSLGGRVTEIARPPMFVLSVHLNSAGEAVGVGLHTDHVGRDQDLGSLHCFPHICYLLTYHHFLL